MNQQPRRRTILSTTSSGTDNKRPFAFSCEELRALHTPKNAAKLRDIGGLEGLINGLLSHRTRGIGGYAPGDGRGGISVGNGHPTSHPEISLVRRIATFPISAVSSRGTNHSDPTRSSEMLPQRRLLFGDNSFPTNERKDSFFHIMWTFYNDPVLFFLTAAAAIALAIGLYQTFTSSHSIDNPPVEWVDGLTILVAVIIIVLVGSLNDWVKSRRLRKIEERGFEAQTTVIRRGTLAHIPSSEVVVGDIVQIQAGDIIPADGILVDGSRIACDESSITAESALVRKTPGDNASRTTTQASPELEPDPFMLSGTKVLEGLGTFIVTATGTHSIYGKAISSLRDHAELTPLQARLTVLTKQLAWMGSIISFILFASLFIKFAARLPHDDRSSVDKGKNFVDIVIIALSVLVIAAPEGIPLALALSLAQGTGSMLRKNVLVRHLKVSETMGTATSVCFDKTGTLTRGSITVVAGTLGLTSLFDEPSSDPTVLISRFADGLSAELRKLALQSLVSCRNFHAGEGELEIAGFDADPALQAFARERLHMQGLDEEGLDEPIRQTVLHHAADSSLATIVKLEDSLYTHRVFIRGNAEVLLSKTTNVIENTSTSPLSTIQLTANGRQFLDSTLQQYNSEGLQIVAIAYRDLCLEEEEVADMSHCLGPEFLLRDLVLLAIFGLQDPLREEAKMTVSICQNASITVRMFTGDSVSAATTVARQSGILRTESSTTVMEGDTFRALSDADRTNILSSLRVLARCTAEDKQLLVDSLKEQGEIIAVVGDGLSDALALSSADVGIAMGGATGTEIARQASSVILMDGKLTGIIEAIMWGRAIKDSVKKYLLVSRLYLTDKGRAYKFLVPNYCNDIFGTGSLRVRSDGLE